MGNNKSKTKIVGNPSQFTSGNNGKAEALDVKSRSCRVIYPNGEENYRNVYEFETAQEFLESCLGVGGHEECAVILFLGLKGEQMIPHHTEFCDYMEEIEYIKIVKQGVYSTQTSDSDGLKKAIKLKS